MREDIKIRTCPFCGQQYRCYPAISRVDNKTEICPDCGVREALDSIGVSLEEQDKILDTIIRYRFERMMAGEVDYREDY